MPPPPQLAGGLFTEKQHLVHPKFPPMVSPIPYSSEVQQTFVSGDNLTLYIILTGVKKAVTFSRYAFYNRETSQETKTSLPANLCPFGPWDDGGTYYFEVGQWPVPNEIGTYEMRVYLGDKIEGSAVFEVVSPP
jgi:hypothetical protein